MKQFFTPNAKAVLVIVFFALSTTASFASQNSSEPVNPTNISIDVVQSDNWVNFKWTTSVVATFNHYEVERSFNNADFTTVGMILDGFDTDNAQKAFRFKDNKSALKGQSIAYYRMKQINNDGTVSYSNVVTVKM